MGRQLVAYFSATGTTAKAAERLSDAIGADLHEILPIFPYTDEDLNWRDPQSRSSLEIRDPSSRPSIAEKRDNMAEYDVVFVGYPIWWYTAPTIVNTFLESYEFTGKTVIPFATSGGSPIEPSYPKLSVSCPGAKLLPGRLINKKDTLADLAKWVDELFR